MSQDHQHYPEGSYIRMPWWELVKVWVEDGWVWGYYRGRRARYIYAGRFMIAIAYRKQLVTASVLEGVVRHDD